MGRGSQFILPPDKALRVRIIAPLEKRARNLAHELGISLDEAESRIVREDAEWKAFARKYFNTNVEYSGHYDLVINSWYMGIEGSVEAIKTALKIKKIPTPSWKKEGKQIKVDVTESSSPSSSHPPNGEEGGVS